MNQGLRSKPRWRFGLRALFAAILLLAISLAVGRLFGVGWGAFALTYVLLAYRALKDPQQLRKSFNVWHLRVFLGMWLLFAIGEFYILSRALSGGPDRPLLALGISAASVLGPLTGAMSRSFQQCCLEFSITLTPYCAVGVGVALLFQVLAMSSNPYIRIMRLLVWAMGLLVWFGGGIVSFGHALA